MIPSATRPCRRLAAPLPAASAPCSRAAGRRRLPRRSRFGRIPRRTVSASLEHRAVPRARPRARADTAEHGPNSPRRVRTRRRSAGTESFASHRPMPAGIGAGRPGSVPVARWRDPSGHFAKVRPLAAARPKKAVTATPCQEEEASWLRHLLGVGSFEPCGDRTPSRSQGTLGSGSWRTCGRPLCGRPSRTSSRCRRC